MKVIQIAQADIFRSFVTIICDLKININISEPPHVKLFYLISSTVKFFRLNILHMISY